MNNTPNLPSKSVGTLFPAEKTKPKSPDMTGKIKIQRKLLEELIEQIRINGAEYAICNIASWAYVEGKRRYMGVELSPFYPPRKQAETASPRPTLDDFFVDGGDDQ
jgi:hypothetical protein